MIDKNNIMLDLETMGHGSNAAIVAIGAVRFHRDIEDRFYRRINQNEEKHAVNDKDSDRMCRIYA